MIKNNTSYQFQLKLQITNDEIIATWSSSTPPSHRYEIYEKSGCFHMEDWGRQTRHNHVYRKVFDLDGNLLADEFVSENHAIVMKA